MQTQRIKSIKKLGIQKTIDLEIDHPDHNFYAEGIVTSNSHSISTSYLSALTVYLKYKHPVEYYWSCLIGSDDLADPIGEIKQIQGELNHFNIKLLPPDILLSQENYSIDGPNIRSGLKGIKGLSGAALEKLSTFKSSVSNKFALMLSLESSKIPVNVVQSLLLSGAMDSLKGNVTRSKLVLEYEIWKELTVKEKNFIVGIGEKYNYDLITIIKACAEELLDGKGNLIIKSSRRETLRRDTSAVILKYRKNCQSEQLTTYLSELQYLGYSPSLSLKDVYKDKIVGLSSTKEIKESKGLKFTLACIIKEAERKVSREKKNPYLKFLVTDSDGELKAMWFQQDAIAETVAQHGEFHEGDIIILHISRKEATSDMFFVNMAVKQHNPVTLKKSAAEKELKEAEAEATS